MPVRDVDRAPRALRLTRPDYPQEAFVKKVEGTVVIEIVIDASGHVVRARVVRSVPLLDQAALDCVPGVDVRARDQGRTSRGQLGNRTRPLPDLLNLSRSSR